MYLGKAAQPLVPTTKTDRSENVIINTDSG